jgi:hypothetical protein
MLIHEYVMLLGKFAMSPRDTASTRWLALRAADLFGRWRVFLKGRTPEATALTEGFQTALWGAAAAAALGLVAALALIRPRDLQEAAEEPPTLAEAA